VLVIATFCLFCDCTVLGPILWVWSKSLQLSYVFISSGSDVGLSNLPESRIEKLLSLVIESVISNVESLVGSKDDQKEYQTLQPVTTESEDVLAEIDDGVMNVPDELPDVLLATRSKQEMTKDNFEESEPGDFFFWTDC